MYTAWTCDQCGKSCRSGDAFCSAKCVEHYENEQLQIAYNGPKDNNYIGDSVHWNNPVPASCGAD